MILNRSIDFGFTAGTAYNFVFGPFVEGDVINKIIASLSAGDGISIIEAKMFNEKPADDSDALFTREGVSFMGSPMTSGLQLTSNGIRGHSIECSTLAGNAHNSEHNIPICHVVGRMRPYLVVRVACGNDAGRINISVDVNTAEMQDALARAEQRITRVA